MNTRVQKLKWHARRSMLELDTLFQEYITMFCYQLDDSACGKIERLFELQDQDLFDAFSGIRPLHDADLNELLGHMVATIRKGD